MVKPEYFNTYKTWRCIECYRIRPRASGYVSTSSTVREKLIKESGLNSQEHISGVETIYTLDNQSLRWELGGAGAGVGGDTEGPWVTTGFSHTTVSLIQVAGGFLPGSRFPCFQPTGSLGGASQSRPQNGHRRDKKDSLGNRTLILLLLHESQ